MSDRARRPANPRSHTDRPRRRALALGALAAALACLCAAPAGAGAFERPFIGSLETISTVASTVPANGDQNPYGIAAVSTTTGSLVAGDILISNFNDAGSAPTGNLQGTGSTIVQLSPSGHLTLFAHITAASLPGPCPGGVGLTTALAVLPDGFVVVGSLPTADGTAATAQAGCLIVLDSSGHPVQTIAGPPINGPWDMTALSSGQSSTLFVTNVLNGTVASGETPTDQGTVVRIRLHGGLRHPPQIVSEQVVAEGFPERTDPAALVVGPTGLALGGDGTLYVADTQGNRIAAVPDALARHAALGAGGRTIAAGGYLANPLGLALAPNGDVLAANANNGDLVETTPEGAEYQPLDTGAGAGGLFGLMIAPSLRGVYFVDDANNTLGFAH